ncbi:MAG: trigger factor [Clostridia bacterium]|nr:trigger factor [Clostridia bacterium]
MKKRVWAFLMIFCLLMTTLMTGCGDTTSGLYNYDLSQYVELGDYKGIEVTKQDVSVTDDEVRAEIDLRREAAYTTEAAVSGVVEEGDTVNIDYAGKVDGKEVANATAKGRELEIGSGSFIDGFEDGLIGVAVGETKVLNLTFPDPYPQNADIAGKPVEFTVTVNSRIIKHVPEYDMDFVKSVSDCKSIKEYEKSVKEDLIAKNEDSARTDMENQIMGTLIADSNVKKYPEKEVNDYKAKQQEYIESYAAYMGTTLDDMLQKTNTTKEDFEKGMTESAQQQVAQEMIIVAIARAENIEVSSSEYEDGVNDLLEKQGYASKEEFEKANSVSFEDYAGKETLELLILLDKVMDFLIDSAKVTPAEDKVTA